MAKKIRIHDTDKPAVSEILSKGDVGLEERPVSKVAPLIAFAVLVALAGISFLGYNLASGDNAGSSDSAVTARAGDVEQSIRDLYEMPTNERVLSTAQITSEEARLELFGDYSELSELSTVGDVYMVFEKNAFLYRPDNNKIIKHIPKSTN